jgi:two-component system sensor histidine kinase AtoS
MFSFERRLPAMPDSVIAEDVQLGSSLYAYQEPMGGDLLSEILAQLMEGVATLRADGVVVSWSPRAASLTGYTLAAINSIGLAQVFDQPSIVADLLQAAKDGTPTHSERLVLLCADGRRVPVDVRCSPLRHLGGAPGHVVVVMRDLSDLETLQNRLLQSERLNILGRLAGAVSHEIRNPLAAIFLHADVLEDELKHPTGGERAQIFRSLRAIKEEVSRLHDLVQQYLSLARLSDLRREPVELGAFLEAFAQETMERLTTRNITMCLEGTMTPVTVALHQNSFRRVLLNLLNNALEAMPQGGMLTLRLRTQGDQAFLDVRDTGCGIPPEQLPLLFSPFHSTKPDGTGLGLYLVREILMAHQGDISVDSVQGHGTTFTMVFPLAPHDDRLH